MKENGQFVGELIALEIGRAAKLKKKKVKPEVIDSLIWHSKIL